MRKNELKKHDGACAKQAGVNARLRCIPVDVLDASNIPQRDEVILACARRSFLYRDATHAVRGTCGGWIPNSGASSRPCFQCNPRGGADRTGDLRQRYGKSGRRYCRAKWEANRVRHHGVDDMSSWSARLREGSVRTSFSGAAIPLVRFGWKFGRCCRLGLDRCRVVATTSQGVQIPLL